MRSPFSSVKRSFLPRFWPLVLLGLAGCGGGGGGGSSPTEPPSNQPAAIQGVWVGTATSVSASGTCLATDFHPLTIPARWDIQQTGGAFTARQTLNNVATCNFRGSISGNTVAFLPDTGGPAFCTVQTIVCSAAPQRPLRMELETATAILTGVVTGSRMSASGTATWHITNAQTGQAVGDYQVRGTQELQKQ